MFCLRCIVPIGSLALVRTPVVRLPLHRPSIPGFTTLSSILTRLFPHPPLPRATPKCAPPLELTLTQVGTLQRLYRGTNEISGRCLLTIACRSSARSKLLCHTQSVKQIDNY